MLENPQAGSVEKDIALAIQAAGGVANLAAVAGVSERTIYAWKNGERYPSRSNLAKVSSYMESFAPAGSPFAAGKNGCPGICPHAPPLSGGLEAHDRPGGYMSGVSHASPSSSVSGSYAPVRDAGLVRLFFPVCVRESQGAVERRPGEGMGEGDSLAESGKGGGLRPSACAGGEVEAFGGEFGAVAFFADPLLCGPHARRGEGQEEVNGGSGYAFTFERLHKMARNVRALRFMHISGRGMEPLLHAGDLCLVDTSDAVLSDDRVYLVRYGSDFFVRRFSRKPGGYLFRNDNRELAYQDFELAAVPSALWEVMGRIVWVGKNL